MSVLSSGSKGSKYYSVQEEIWINVSGDAEPDWEPIAEVLTMQEAYDAGRNAKLMKNGSICISYMTCNGTGGACGVVFFNGAQNTVPLVAECKD